MSNKIVEVPVTSQATATQTTSPETPKAKAAAADVDGLTPTERAELRRKLDRADGLDQDDEVATDPDRYTWTNLTQADVMVPDLGFGKGRNFESFSFAPHQVIDLHTLFSKKEIGKSHYLKRLAAQDPPILKNGRATQAELQRHIDPLGALVAANTALAQTGVQVNLADPLFGQREFDKKLEHHIKTGPGGEREDTATMKR